MQRLLKNFRFQISPIIRQGHTFAHNFCTKQWIKDSACKTVSGKELNEKLNGMPLLKFMNNTDIHYDFEYMTGKNKDVNSFTPSGCCEPGGLYFTSLIDFSEYYDCMGIIFN